MHHTRSAALIFLLLATPVLPAAAQPFGFPGLPGAASGLDWADRDRPLGLSHGVTGRFGVISYRDPATGARRTEPWAAAGLWLNLGHETDAGWRVDFTVGVEAVSRDPLFTHRPVVPR